MSFQWTDFTDGRDDREHRDVRDDRQLVNHILDLFEDKPQRLGSSSFIVDTREPLEVEFICRLIPSGKQNYILGMELKLGPQRPYIVRQLRPLLDKLEQRSSYVFSNHFTYDPSLHSFRSEDEAVLRQLISVYRHEQLYKETLESHLFYAGHRSAERVLLVPPVFWNAMLPLLAAAPRVKLIHETILGRLLEEHVYDGIQLSDDALPLRFTLDQADGETGYLLSVQGIDNVVPLGAYGMVMVEGKLIKLSEPMCRRLSKLKHMLASARKPHIRIASEQIESMVEKVIPGLMKLGGMHIAESVSAKIIQLPLKARLYLDRVRDRLLAGLEFQYGDLVINPLEGAKPSRGSESILMRDGELERRILSLMEREAFMKTEGGYVIEGDEAEYELLYHVIPHLEKLMDIYATTAVKERLFVEHAPPRISLNFDERTDWLEIKFELDGIPEKEIRLLIQSLEEKRKYYRLASGALMPLETEQFQALLRVMNAIGLHHSQLHNHTGRLPALKALTLLDLSRQTDGTIKLGKSLRKLLEDMRNPDNIDFPVPSGLEPVLRDYQKYGYQWMKTLAHYHFGGILADDMGLGKTIQSIAFIESVLPEIRSRQMPALIVSPSSLLYNWLYELKKFAPNMCAVIADGNKDERWAALYAGGNEQDGTEAPGADVIITSYPLLRRDIAKYAKLSFHTLILDEAQAFKNYTTQTARAVKGLQAKYKFALTGTPMENRLEELWSIFDTVLPGLFGNRKEFLELPQETVARRIRPFLLRRLKDDVLKELPEKIEMLQASELLPEQKKLYAAYLAKLRQETLKHLDSDDFGRARIKILAGITRLRQLCCHPGLFVEGYEGSSAKFEQLFQIIEECRSAGKRMLIFSQFTEMLGFIGRELGLLGVPFFYLDGSTPSAERVQLCRRFNEGERDLFLISLKAGGTGLNLTGADTVILYDLWWNPAVEQQAADRAHRIGQKRVVQVIRLVAQGTVEDKMYELQQRKKSLIDEVIQPGEQSLSSLTEQDIRELLMLE